MQQAASGAPRPLSGMRLFRKDSNGTRSSAVSTVRSSLIRTESQLASENVEFDTDGFGPLDSLMESDPGIRGLGSAKCMPPVRDVVVLMREALYVLCEQLRMAHRHNEQLEQRCLKYVKQIEAITLEQESHQQGARLQAPDLRAFPHGGPRQQSLPPLQWTQPPHSSATATPSVATMATFAPAAANTGANLEAVGSSSTPWPRSRAGSPSPRPARGTQERPEGQPRSQSVSRCQKCQTAPAIAPQSPGAEAPRRDGLPSHEASTSSRGPPPAAPDGKPGKEARRMARLASSPVPSNPESVGLPSENSAEAGSHKSEIWDSRPEEVEETRLWLSTEDTIYVDGHTSSASE